MSTTGWTRIVVEKPFGKDVTSFSDLMDSLSIFPEDQVYKIDHYLGKDILKIFSSLPPPLIFVMFYNLFSLTIFSYGSEFTSIEIC